MPVRLTVHVPNEGTVAMADDRPEDTDAVAGFGPRQARAADHRPRSHRGIRRDPHADGDAGAANRRSESRRHATAAGPGFAAVSSGVVAPISGAVAAALVIGVGWMLGWPSARSTPAAAPQANTAAIDGARRADRQRRGRNQPRLPAAAPDPAAAARIEALEKSLASLRGELADARAQSEKLAAAVNDVKSAPREAAASPDLSAINERLAQIERATRAQSAEIAQENAKPADDARCAGSWRRRCSMCRCGRAIPMPRRWRRRNRWPPNPDALKPLEGFAASGVPSAAVLSRELLTLVPKLSPPAPENATTGAGIVDRCRPAPQSWSASSAPMRSAPIAAPSSRGSPRRRCATISPRRGAN